MVLEKILYFCKWFILIRRSFIQPAESHCSVPLALARFNSFADSFTTQHAGAKLSKYKPDQCLKRQLYSFRCKHEALGTSQSSSSGCFLGMLHFWKYVLLLLLLLSFSPRETWNRRQSCCSCVTESAMTSSSATPRCPSKSLRERNRRCGSGYHDAVPRWWCWFISIDTTRCQKYKMIVTWRRHDSAIGLGVSLDPWFLHWFNSIWKSSLKS